MRDKRKLTEILVGQLDPELGISIEQAYNTWWHNLRKNSGLRLTQAGSLVFLNELKFQHYTYNVDPFSLTSKLMLIMDRKLQQPYYIVTKKLIPVQIIFFGSKEAMLVQLYNDLNKFLDNY